MTLFSHCFAILFFIFNFIITNVVKSVFDNFLQLEALRGYKWKTMQ